MTILYSNGCSYTGNNWVERDQRYPKIIADHFKWNIQDSAIPGSCNRQIIRCSMRDVIELSCQNEPVVALIQLTHLFRFEYAGTKVFDNQWKYANNDLFESVKPADESNWPTEIQTWAKHTILLQKPMAELEKLFCSIVGIVGLFEQLGITYKIFSGPPLKTDVPMFDQSIFYDYLKSNSNVLDLMNFNMLGLTNSNKHPNVEGMQTIADYFINQLIQSK